MDLISGFILERKSYRTINFIILCQKLCDIDTVYNRYIFLFLYCLGKDRLEVLSVDLNITVSSGDIITILIFQDHKTKIFHICSHFIEMLRCGKQQILSDNTCGILPGIIDIILWSMPLRDISVDRVDSCCQTSAPLNMGFLRNHHGQPCVTAQSQCCVTACGTSSDDQYICVDLPYFKIFTHGTILSVSFVTLYFTKSHRLLFRCIQENFPNAFIDIQSHGL